MKKKEKEASDTNHRHSLRNLSSYKCRGCSGILLVVQMRRGDGRFAVADVVAGVADCEDLGGSDTSE
jgi:hypothetical protein